MSNNCLIVRLFFFADLFHPVYSVFLLILVTISNRHCIKLGGLTLSVEVVSEVRVPVVDAVVDVNHLDSPSSRPRLPRGVDAHRRRVIVGRVQVPGVIPTAAEEILSAYKLPSKLECNYCR